MHTNGLTFCCFVSYVQFTIYNQQSRIYVLNSENVKTKRRCSFRISTLCDLLELNIEGPSLSQFSADAAVDLWWTECCTTCRVNQKPRKKCTGRGATSNQNEEEPEAVESTQSLVLNDLDN